MTCDQFDDFHNSVERLPASAREHLRNCERCRDIRMIWDAPLAAVDLPPDLQIRITNDLVSKLRPVRPAPGDGILMLSLVGLALLAAAAGVWRLGDAGWKALAPRQAAVVFSCLGGALLLISHVATRRMIPGARQRISPAIAIVTVCAVLSAAVLLMFPYARDEEFVRRGLLCWARGMMFATAAAALFFPILRRSAWLTPLGLGAATGFLAGLSGVTVLEICCPNLDGAHVGVWHLGTALTSMLIAITAAAMAAHRKYTVTWPSANPKT
jgi:hypothetical protein